MEGVSLKDAVRSACEYHGLDFDTIIKVEQNHQEHPTKVTVWFEGDAEPLVMDITYPQQA